MTNSIRKDLNDLSIVSLMDIERAIALSDDLISEDPSVVLQTQEELLAVIGKRNKKIDGIEWARQEAQRDLEWITSQEEECKKTKKRLKSKLESLKNLLKFLANYSGSNEIKGSVWHWTLADVKKRKVEVNTDTMETWDDETKERERRDGEREEAIHINRGRSEEHMSELEAPKCKSESTTLLCGECLYRSTPFLTFQVS